MSRPILVPTVDAIPLELNKASGVYVIRSHATRRVLYVGESHTNQLRRTIMRHFNAWPMDYFHKEPRAVYDRRRVSVEITVTAAGDAIPYQDEQICALEPRDNIRRTGCEKSDDPF